MKSRSSNSPGARAKPAGTGDAQPLAAINRVRKQRAKRAPRARATEAMGSPEPTAAPAKKTFPVVGLGASAGGLEAFTQLLGSLPTDTGMAFVLVQHLDPDHPSLLPNLLASTTRMPVLQVRDGMKLEPNQLYVIPPNAGMVMTEGSLKLLPRQKIPAPQRCIDLFFESLAQIRRHEAIGVILSGTASDGTLGLEAIKGEGGVTFAQDDSAKFNSMPRNAINAGCVDFVLPPEGIARELGRIARHPVLVRPDGEAEAELAPEFRNGFKEILGFVRGATGVDFNLYKPGMLHRRVKRRMVLTKAEDFRAYGQFLAHNPAEVHALAQDFLIGVTSFFRDPASFEYLQKEVFPKILQAREKRGVDEPVRVWVPGCSTGQEVYSLAIAWEEFAEKARSQTQIQLFGTDLGENYLEKARAGLYPKSVVQDVSRERLRRFFYEADSGYRLSKSIRERCVFARHNLASDPPFSRIDLISCRNLLIYLEPEVQKRIVSVFHFALKDRGFLFLGRAEGTSGFAELFKPLHSTHKVFAKRMAPAHVQMHFTPSLARKVKPGVALSRSAHLESGVQEMQREADRVLLTRYAPAGVVITAEGQIVQFRGHTGDFLESPPGRATLNVLKMAREGLYSPLRTLLLKARKTMSVARAKAVKVSQDDHTRTIDVEVIPLQTPSNDGPFFLLLFDTAPERLAQLAGRESTQKLKQGAGSRQLRDEPRLKRELEDTKAHLNAIIQEQETYSEELQAAHEEGQASNEELQSINEELETSKEELQATNEELGTINAELQARNSELTLVNEDLANLLGSVRVPIVMVGIDMRIRRFNAAAATALNLIPTDLGRPIGNLRPPVEGVNLEELLSEVTRDVVVKEREVQNREGRWLLLRAHPYRTGDNKIDGAILVLIDIDELKRTTESRDYSQAVINTLHEPLLVLRADLRIYSANRAFYQLFGGRPEEIEGQLIYDLSNAQWDLPGLREQLEHTIPRTGFFTDFEVTKDFGGLGRRTFLLNARRLEDRSPDPQKILLAIEDITERRKSEKALRASEVRYRRLFESAKDGILILSPTTRRVIDVNPFMSDLLGFSREEFLEKELWEIGLLPDERATDAAFRQLQQKGFLRYDNLPLRTKTGETRAVEFVANRYQESGQQAVVQCNLRDVTEREQMLRTLQAAEEFRRLMIDSVRDHAIFTLDQEARINTWNQGAERMFGYTDAEILGQSVEILFTPEDREANVPEQEMRSARETGHATDERWHVGKAGKRLFATGEMTPIRDQEGNLRGYTKVARDITKEKDREIALAEQARLLDLSNDAIIVRDTDHHITYWNHGAEDLYGYTSAEAQGKHLHALLKCQFPEPLENILQKLSSEQHWSGEISQTTRDGRHITVSSRWALDPAPIGGPPCILETNTDITKSKRAEKALRQARDKISQHAVQLERNVTERTTELTDANKQLEAFVYTIAHDLRAPLRSMEGFSAMLAEEAGPALSETARDFVNRINQSALFMDNLLTDLLAFSRMSQQRIELTPVNLQSSVSNALSQLQSEIQGKHARVEIDERWPTVLAYPPTLSQALVNLIGNALKFVKPGVTPLVRVRSEEKGEWVRVWVEDNGIGIAPEHQEQVFRLFRRLHGEDYAGTGIGLAIVQRGIERMGGCLGVESALGDGSRFWFELRAVP